MPDIFNNERVRVAQMTNIPCLFLSQGHPCPLGSVCPCAHTKWERHVLLHPDHCHSHMPDYQCHVAAWLGIQECLPNEATEDGEKKTATLREDSTVALPRSPSAVPPEGQRVARVAQMHHAACLFFSLGHPCPLEEDCPCAHEDWELQTPLRPDRCNARVAEYQCLVSQLLGVEECHTDDEDEEEEEEEETAAPSLLPSSPTTPSSPGDGLARVAQMTSLSCWFADVGMPCPLGDTCPRAHNEWERHVALRPHRCNTHELEYQEHVHTFLGIQPCTVEEQKEEEEAVLLFLSSNPL